MAVKIPDREYRAIVQPFQIPETTTDKRIDSDFYVEGVATIFDTPYELFEIDGVKYYEVIEKNALDEADMSDVILRYDHEGKVMARKSNGTLIIEPKDKLYIYADLSKSRAAKDLYEEIQNGLVTKMSWAFKVRERSFDSKTRTIRIRKVAKVYDVAPVGVPAFDATSISARSFVDGVIEQEQQELLKRKRLLLQLQIIEQLGGKIL
jgi:HK97 family phage prohead protease